jgi:hypothetical protein
MNGCTDNPLECIDIFLQSDDDLAAIASGDDEFQETSRCPRALVHHNMIRK